jgi:hypothetical protein
MAMAMQRRKVSLMRSGFVLLAMLFGLAACRESAPVKASLDSGVGIDAGAAISAVHEARAELTLVGDAGRQTFDLLKTDGGWLDSSFEDVPSALELRVEPVPAVAVRVRLLDWTNRLVSSDDVMETDAQRLQYNIRLLEPLRRGRTYQLELDAESEVPVAEDAGMGEVESLWRFRVAGEIEPEPTAAKKSSGGQLKPKANKGRRRR